MFLCLIQHNAVNFIHLNLWHLPHSYPNAPETLLTTCFQTVRQRIAKKNASQNEKHPFYSETAF